MPKSKSTPQSVNQSVRELTKAKKRKGKPSGNRNSMAESAKLAQRGGAKKDPRLGSKKPIPLIKTSDSQKAKPKKRFATPQEELMAIENDPQVQKLMMMIENEQPLSAHDQQFFDAKMKRHRILCELMGIEDEPEIDEEQDDTFGDSFHSDWNDYKDME